MTFHVPEKWRVRSGNYGSDASYGNNGAFLIKSLKLRSPLSVIASDGMSWEHVSVSRRGRCPTWDEMSLVKSIFWDPWDQVVQFHPPEDDYVNCHPYTLHLWRYATDSQYWCPSPPGVLVGPKL